MFKPFSMFIQFIWLKILIERKLLYKDICSLWLIR